MPELGGFEATRRRLTGRQIEIVDRLTGAAMKLLRQVGMTGLTIRAVASLAGVGSATAYSYFSSKEHLIAEIFWRRLTADPAAPGDDVDRDDRLLAVLRGIAMLVSDEPALASAATGALLSPDPDVAHLRFRIGMEIHQRLIRAWGPDPDIELIEHIELLQAGALVRAGMGYASYSGVLDAMERAVRRVLL